MTLLEMFNCLRDFKFAICNGSFPVRLLLVMVRFTSSVKSPITGGIEHDRGKKEMFKEMTREF
jgi:hypothetical protein